MTVEVLLKILYNITGTGKLLRSNAKMGDFFLQWEREIDHENGKLLIKKGELEHLLT